MVLQSGNGLFAIRHKQWKLIPGPGPGGFSQAKPGPGAPAGQLFDLRADLAEQHNLYQEKPEIFMHPIFDAVWQACGLPRSYNYDEQGNWTRR